jgi:hypothetical protein
MMLTTSRAKLCSALLKLSFFLGLFCFLLATPKAQAQESEEFDSYRLRLEGFWLYASPSGTLQGSSGTYPIDLQQTLHFETYSTFYGKLDWKFTRKNHLFVVAVPYNSSRSVVLNRTVVFQGQTFEASLSVQAKLRSPMYALGYQYDIVRRRRGHFGLAAQFNAFDTHASINAAAQVTGNGVQQRATSASASLIAPIPIAGPEFRYYLTNSPRLFVEGFAYGMYFFGYGNYASGIATLGFSVNRHLSINGGYGLASRLEVRNKSSTNRIGVDLTQRGPLVGVELSF